MNTAEDIKQRLDIVSIISEYVELEKAGRNFRGLCPFHTEKTPSFFVFPERQSWRCFGCNEGGDLISFMMKKEGLDFSEALKILAPRAGITLPERKQRAFEDERIPRLHEINESAANYYHQLLLESPAAEHARKYVQNRYLTPETVKEFRLGFSLDSWDGLKNYLQKQGYKETEMVSAGLLIAKEDRAYDRFRGRLMFPITDPKGRVIGFGARALDDSTPKYLNSAESPVFAKNSVLYGIDRAKESIRQQGKAVIVEGYMDVLTAHQHGFRNVIASMGTALTENQIAILKGLTRHICLSLDADAAGSAATLRGIEVCRNALAEKVQGPKGWLGGPAQLGTEISIISMPEGKDPDEVIRENPEEWQGLVENASPLMDHLFATTAGEFDLSRPEEVSQFVSRLVPLIAEMGDSGSREVYLTKLSKLTGLSDRVLRGKIADLLYQKKPGKKQPKKVELSPSVRTGDPIEEQCLVLLLKYTHLRDKIGGLSPHHFERSENREIFLALRDISEENNMEGKLSPILQEHLQELNQREQPPSDKDMQERELAECVHRLEVRRRQAALAAEKDIEENSVRLKELWHQRSTSSQR
ncbi:MAG: DNA primase [Dehalococcoidia bacterium]